VEIGFLYIIFNTDVVAKAPILLPKSKIGTQVEFTDVILKAGTIFKIQEVKDEKRF
jgi:hypothetical protein